MEHEIYKENLTNTQKELIAASKDFQLYDYGFIFPFIGICIKSMKKYYEEEDNVYQKDESRLELLASITKACELFDAMVGADFNHQHETTIAFFTYLGEHIEEWWD